MSGTYLRLLFASMVGLSLAAPARAFDDFAPREEKAGQGLDAAKAADMPVAGTGLNTGKRPTGIPATARAEAGSEGMTRVALPKSGIESSVVGGLAEGKTMKVDVTIDGNTVKGTLGKDAKGTYVEVPKAALAVGAGADKITVKTPGKLNGNAPVTLVEGALTAAGPARAPAANQPQGRRSAGMPANTQAVDAGGGNTRVALPGLELTDAKVPPAGQTTAVTVNINGKEVQGKLGSDAKGKPFVEVPTTALPVGAGAKIQVKQNVAGLGVRTIVEGAVAARPAGPINVVKDGASVGMAGKTAVLLSPDTLTKAGITLGEGQKMDVKVQAPYELRNQRVQGTYTFSATLVKKGGDVYLVASKGDLKATNGAVTLAGHAGGLSPQPNTAFTIQRKGDGGGMVEVAQIRVTAPQAPAARVAKGGERPAGVAAGPVARGLRNGMTAVPLGNVKGLKAGDKVQVAVPGGRTVQGVIAKNSTGKSFAIVSSQNLLPGQGGAVTVSKAGNAIAQVTLSARPSVTGRNDVVRVAAGRLPGVAPARNGASTEVTVRLTDASGKKTTVQATVTRQGNAVAIALPKGAVEKGGAARMDILDKRNQSVFSRQLGMS